MKTPIWLSCAAIIALSLGVDSCDSYSDLVTDSLPSASFLSNSLSITESAGEQYITIRLDKPIASDGYVALKVISQGELPINTEPAIKQGVIKLPIVAGRSLVNLKVQPIDNGRMDGMRKVSLSLVSVEASYVAGIESFSLITIADDESPSRVEFAGSEASLSESASGGDQIDLRFSAPAPAAGIVIVETRMDCKYSKDFFTIPSLVNGKLFLPVGEGQSSVGVKVFPINDAVKRADRHITFQLVEAGGGVMQDPQAGTFQLWIVEDDVNAGLMPLAPAAAGKK
jgi:hypothetical protein